MTDRHTVNTITSNALDALYARIATLEHAALDTGQHAPAWTPPPPGSTREQLPPAVLALLPDLPYTSTACDTAHACQTAADTHPVERPWLTAHADELHARCRLNHKFTGQMCVCACHGEQPAPGPAATQTTEAATTTRVFAALHRSAEQDVSRVIALYERWVQAGAPPIGTSMSRWWDARLAELHDAIRPPEQQSGTAAGTDTVQPVRTLDPDQPSGPAPQA
jgi:hypothetical protein